ncbi:MAG: hypothetical protein IRZ03_08175 [Acidobacterium ailaaui]|jgi:predicted HicB family RNase H-like nuclease|nr:hypothetical protein [Pseudacidobacterium ailaaui]
MVTFFDNYNDLSNISASGSDSQGKVLVYFNDTCLQEDAFPMPEEYKQRHCFPLRLSATMRRQANDLAHREGISLNHFISLAIAEKISRMEYQVWLQEQAKPDTLTSATPISRPPSFDKRM